MTGSTATTFGARGLVVVPTVKMAVAVLRLPLSFELIGPNRRDGHAARQYVSERHPGQHGRVRVDDVERKSCIYVSITLIIRYAPNSPGTQPVQKGPFGLN